MKDHFAPKNYTNIDASDKPQHWVNLMLEWDALPTVHLQRQQLCQLLNLSDNDRILMAGCGPGTVSRYLSGEKRSLLGVDQSSVMIEYATQHYSSDLCRFLQADICKPLDVDSTFDCIWIERVLHHIPDAALAVKALCQCLQPGGRIALAEPYIPSTIVTPLLDGNCQEFANRWSSHVANGTIGLTIQPVLRELGFTLSAQFGSMVIMDDYAQVSQFIDLGLFLQNQSDDHIQQQKQAWLQAAESHDFMLAWPMINTIFTRQS